MAKQNDQQTQNVPDQPSGIFEPKPLNASDIPLSGAQKAMRLTVALAAIILAVIIWLLLRNPFMNPVNKYYKGITKGDTAIMCDAFPSWLVNADTGAENMTINDMCAAMLTYTRFSHGADCKVKASLVSKTAVDEEYLEQIASGIRAQYAVNVKITKGWWLKLAVTYQQGDNESTETQYARLYRINGKWVLLDIPSDTQ